ncbi:tRNA threonylcarbamoyladenosine dehydratase [Claveliimonas bilis]|uniref:tRNA threonylcarbamoyladenosine dehydratase n=1 Tax=Claveliimonas bilis TaxID=3028070 RepID=UPI001E487616|nr:tRNA threonylcarbamoyladenosine dehydratase [Claveliimonas bilis]BCZ26193.1 tRNA threonylcarbamoyladenosine dehydratase [Claveliimonas bilis]
MIHEFSRTELLIGPEKFRRIKKASIMVFGIGGVGSHCIEALARTGVGKLILVDNDKVSVTNINRQSIAFHSTVGEYKTQVMKRKILDICPDTEVETHEVFVLPDNVDSILDCRPDYIVDAIDTVTAKLALAKKAMEYNIPIISSMGTGNKLHGEMFEIEDISRTSVCPLCKVMRRELKKQGITHLKVLYSKEKPVKTDPDKMEEDPGTRRSLPGSISFVPPVAGLLIAGEVIRDIAGL